MARFEDPAYYVDKPRADLRKTVLCTSLSVLAKSAAALLVSRHLEELPGSWDIVCVWRAGDATGADLSPVFGEARPFAPDVRVWTKTFGSCSWVSVYVTGTAMACFFFLIDDDRTLVEGIRERFPGEPCLRFQGTSLMDLVGHDWPAVELSGTGSRTRERGGDRGAGPRVTCGASSWPVAALFGPAAVGARTRLKQGRERSILDLL